MEQLCTRTLGEADRRSAGGKERRDRPSSAEGFHESSLLDHDADEHVDRLAEELEVLSGGRSGRMGMGGRGGFVARPHSGN